MNYVIAVMGQKGGVGKSTLAQLVAQGYAKAEYSVLLADMDTNQQSSVKWNETRIEANIKPEITVKSFLTVASAQAEAKKHDYGLLVFDGAGQATTQTRDMAKIAHLVLLPTSTSKFCMNPQIMLAHELVRDKVIQPKQIRFVLSRITATPAELNAARDYIKAAGYSVLAESLEEKTGYRNAQEEGKALAEVKFKSLAARSLDVFSIVSTSLSKAL